MIDPLKVAHRLRGTKCTECAWFKAASDPLEHNVGWCVVKRLYVGLVSPLCSAFLDTHSVPRNPDPDYD